MNPLLLLQCELKIASRIKGARARLEEINRVVEEAKLYYPQCFKETQGNLPKERIRTKFEIYIDGLIPTKHTITLGETK